MGADFSLNGVSDLIEELANLGRNVEAITDQSLIKAATTMQLEAKKILKTPSPHHKGDEYYSAPSARDGDNSKIIKGMKISKVVHGYKKGTHIKVYNSDRDSILTEFGHSGKTAPAHPFLAPAFERKKKEAEEIIVNNLIGALSK